MGKSLFLCRRAYIESDNVFARKSSLNTQDLLYQCRSMKTVSTNFLFMEGLMEHLTEVNEKQRAPEVGSVHGNH